MFGKMLEANDAARMLNGDSYKIALQELEKSTRLKKLRNSQMCIEFNDLCYSARRNRKGIEKIILHNVTGHFELGKVTVIIGPSGAGKTTLLNILSGREMTNVKGTVTVNGIESNKKMLRKQVCYLPQEFYLLPYLTTRETLYIAARLKLDVNQNKAICSIVNDIAESLSLSNCLDTLANKLNNSERKRLYIGMEIITKPSILLLDEPTSLCSLDEANKLGGILQDMARGNCTVVCVMQQPSSQMISLFDNIMVLDRGRCMYCGPRSEILNTYSVAGFTCPDFYNIAEFVLEVITEKSDENLENLYKICHDEYEKFKLQNKHNENELIESKQEYEDNIITSMNSIIPKKSMWQQQKILFLRALICMKRDNISTKLRFAIHVAYGLFLGTLYYNFGGDGDKVISNIACVFLFMMVLYFGNAIPTMHTYPTEMKVFQQEHLNNWYSLMSYYSVKILTDLLMQILCTSTFLFIAYYMTAQPMEYVRILQMWNVSLLITIIGQTVAVLTVAIIGLKLGILLLPVISVILILFAGFLLKLNEMSVYLQPLSITNYFRYALEGLLQAIYLNRSPMPCSIFCYLRSPNQTLSLLMNMPTVSYSITLIILGSWLLGLHIIIYAVLSWRIYYARK